MELIDPTIEDRSVVSTLVNLEGLSIKGVVEDIDFSRLSRLQDCTIEDAGSIGNVGACPALKELRVDKAKVEDLSRLTPLTQLTTLTLLSVPLRSLHQIEQLVALQKLDLTQCYRFTALDGIEQTHITELWLDILPRLHSIAPLLQLRSLRKLELTSCKQIEDFERLGELNWLQTLWITTCRDLPSKHFLELT